MSTTTKKIIFVDENGTKKEYDIGAYAKNVLLENGGSVEKEFESILTRITGLTNFDVEAAAAIAAMSAQMGDLSSQQDKMAQGIGIQDASTAQKGIVQLNSATNSTSTTQAATPSAVKSAYDLANGRAPLASPAFTGTPTLNGKSIATAEPPTWYDLPLVSGYTGSIKYAKDQFGWVSVVLGVNKTDNSALTFGANGFVIATLPVGYRPKIGFSASANYFTSAGGLLATLGRIWVSTSGQISLYGVGETASCSSIGGNLGFFAQ